MGTTFFQREIDDFSDIFARTIFFDFPDNENLQKKLGLLLKIRICSYGGQFLPIKVDPIDKGG